LQTEKGGQIITLARTWKNNDKITVKLPMELSTSNWGKNSRTVERGPLIYALRLEEQWEKDHQEVEGDYYSIFPKGKWNYGLLDEVIKRPDSTLKVKRVKEIGSDFVWNLNHAPIEIIAPAKQIPGWNL